jgi:hypothetical protein
MLFQSEDLVLAHAKQHRQQLLDEAHAHRQARHAPRARHRPGDRLFHAAGALLVRWGTHLQQRGHAVPTTFVETRPA